MKLKGFGASLLFMTVLLSVAEGVSVAELRCGTRLVHEGDSKAQVIHKCGEPSFVESWKEERIQRDYYRVPIYSRRAGKFTWYREPFLVKEIIRIEEWTYNSGSTQFIRYLRFENGILRDIFIGGYGY